jgi:serine/threonine protein kinase
MNCKIVVNTEDEKLKNELKNIEAIFSSCKENIHKARNEIKIIEINEKKYVVKSFKKPHIINRIAYTYLRGSKAEKSYENSLKIGDFAPNPIAYLEFFDNLLLSRSYFISDLFEYDFTIREPLLDKNFPDREMLLQEFAKFSYEMHEKNIFHNDYSPGNILIKKDGSRYIFKVVDVNRMKFISLSSQERARNFSQLWANDDDLQIITDAYLQKYKTDEDFLAQTLYFSRQHKQRKNFKKRLRGEEIND